MDRYLQQLIEDLRAAAENVPGPGELWSGVDMNNPAEVEDMAYVEQYLEGTPQKLAEIVGLEKIAFPLPEKLSEAQSILLYTEMTRLLEAYHFVPDFPQDLPEPIRYRVLRAHWDSDQVFIGAGEIHMEFCTYEPDDCPFPRKYCDCLRIEKEEEDMIDRPNEDLDEDALPF